MEDVTAELKPRSICRRRLDVRAAAKTRAAAGGEFKAEATIETKDETVAQAAKEKLAEKVRTRRRRRNSSASRSPRTRRRWSTSRRWR